MSTANDDAWSRFFSKTDTLTQIDKSGYTQITADALKSYGQREPRLMAKLDTNSERPQVFKQNHLNILPVQNGLYVIFRDSSNQLYFQFDTALEDTPVEQYAAKMDLQTFDSFRLGTLSSESQVIDFAFLASLFHHFCECDEMHLTIRGRLYSGQFSMELPINHHVDISNVQIEVDSGYESKDSIIIVEAKIGRRSDFNIRQLVYPYLQWSQRSKKRIRPIFLTYSNGQYVLTEFAVGKSFGDVRIVTNRAFVINDSPLTVVDLAALLHSTPTGVEPEGIPFPQADDMDKVVDLIKLLERGVGTKTAIAEFFEFDERQSDYYSNAAAYLGFAFRNRNTRGFELTPKGREFLALPTRTQRTRVLLDKLLERPSMRDSIDLLRKRRFDLSQLSLSEIESIIVSKTGVSPTADTLPRRARTVRMWLQWLLKNGSFTDASQT